MPPVRSQRRVDGTKNNRRSVTKDPSRKDLIHIRNRQNGKVYKFACGTCISGHRAPQCDPVKHKDKVLFRRPEPGRPAKTCGHPVSLGCDCKAQRNLCCLLAPDQWAELVAGGIPTATMYESEEHLNRVQDEERRAREAREAFQQAQAYEQAMLAANQFAYPAMPYRPAPHEMPIVQDPGQMAFPYLYNQVMPEQFGFFDDQQDLTTFDPAAYQVPIEAPYQAPAGPSFEPVFYPEQVFHMPGPAPRSQFPCGSCASYQCTCLRCPPVSQGSDGAWSGACARTGHRDNTAPLKQEYGVSTEAGSFHQPPLDTSQLTEFTQCCETPLTFEEILGLADFPQSMGL